MNGQAVIQIPGIFVGIFRFFIILNDLLVVFTRGHGV
jgi:hypothetical protein